MSISQIKKREQKALNNWNTVQMDSVELRRAEFIISIDEKLKLFW